VDHQQAPTELFEATLGRVVDLLDWRNGWNGYDALAPDRDSVKRALVWVSTLYAEVRAVERPWLAPNVTAGAEGEVVFEWWQGDRKLTVYIEHDAVSFLQVWGDGIGTQVVDGDAISASVCRTLWLWLTA